MLFNFDIFSSSTYREVVEKIWYKTQFMFLNIHFILWSVIQAFVFFIKLCLI